MDHFNYLTAGKRTINGLSIFNIMINIYNTTVTEDFNVITKNGVFRIISIRSYMSVIKEKK